MSAIPSNKKGLYWTSPKSLSLQIRRIVRRGSLVLLQGDDKVVEGALFRVATPAAAELLEAAIIREKGRMRLHIGGKRKTPEGKNSHRSRKRNHINLDQFGPSSIVLIFRDAGTLVIGNWPEKVLAWPAIKPAATKTPTPQN
jgi:hypothetical protein